MASPTFEAEIQIFQVKRDFKRYSCFSQEESEVTWSKGYLGSHSTLGSYSPGTKYTWLSAHVTGLCFLEHLVIEKALITENELFLSFFLFYLLLFLSFPSWSFISLLIFPLWDLSNRISWTSSGTVKITHLLTIILYYIINLSFQDKGSRFLHFGQRSSSEQAISHTLVSKVRAKGDLAPCFKRHNRETLTHTPKYIHYSLTSHMGCIYVVIVLWSVPRQKLSTKQSYNSGESECRSLLLLPLSCIYKHFKMWLRWQWEENRINGKLWIGCWQENDVEMPRGR